MLHNGKTKSNQILLIEMNTIVTRYGPQACGDPTFLDHTCGHLWIMALQYANIPVLFWVLSQAFMKIYNYRHYVEIYNSIFILRS